MRSSTLEQSSLLYEGAPEEETTWGPSQKISARTHERTRGRKVAKVLLPLKTHRINGFKVHCPHFGVVVKGSLAQVSSSSLDRGSKLEVRPNSPSVAHTGRPRVTTPNEDRYLAVTAKRNRRSTASGLSRQLSSATGTTVSRQTMYRRLGHIGL
ncbi:transposable element Tcb1 transposase [Trichonephila clavipes]|nr:transposable element Tcb1 transposase [Trichonephila clavipes]